MICLYCCMNIRLCNPIPTRREPSLRYLCAELVEFLQWGHAVQHGQSSFIILRAWTTLPDMLLLQGGQKARRRVSHVPIRGCSWASAERTPSENTLLVKRMTFRGGPSLRTFPLFVCVRERERVCVCSAWWAWPCEPLETAKIPQNKLEH